MERAKSIWDLIRNGMRRRNYKSSEISVEDQELLFKHGKRIFKENRTMGYRSDVGYSVRFKDIGAMHEVLAVIAAMHPVAYTALEECWVDTENCELHFYAESVKWYEEYADVKNHTQFLDALDEEAFEGKVAWCFSRVGEEIDDNTSNYGGDTDLVPWENVHMVRRIELGVNVSNLNFFDTTKTLDELLAIDKA
jgi:hypothetical protein